MSIDNLFFSLGVYRQPFLFGNSSRPLLIIPSKNVRQNIKNWPLITSSLNTYFKWMSIDNFFCTGEQFIRVKHAHMLFTHFFYPPFYNPHVTTKKMSHNMYMSHIEKPKASSRERSRRLLEDVDGRRSVIKNFI